MAHNTKTPPTPPPSTLASNARKSQAELEREFVELKEKIKALLGREDRQNPSMESQGKLRTYYSKMAMIARSIALQQTENDIREKWMKNYTALLDSAAQYGSVARGTVPTTKLDDVKGLENVKSLVKSFIFMSENTGLRKYYKIEGGLGMMMYGAPGTGKTMFAEAVANARNLPLFVVTPADIFKSYVGQSEQSVKLLFQEMDACEEGAILFIDECESIFSKRSEGTKDYKSAVTTELLQRINGFGNDGSNRILIAATNRPDEIDPAYLRYKRFSYLIHITPPDEESIRAIMTSKLKGIACTPDANMDALMKLVHENTHDTKRLANGESMAFKTHYYSAADICGIIEEACRLALAEIEARGETEPIPLTLDMFKKAFNKIPPSISQELYDTYEDFRKNINS